MKTEQEYELLLSSVSHEIRNPVTLIGSYLQLLSSAHPEVEQYEYWNTVTDEVQRLKSLLSELSAFNNGMRIRTERLDFGPWIRHYAETADMLIRSVSSSGQTAISMREHRLSDMDSVLASSVSDFPSVAEAPAYHIAQSPTISKTACSAKMTAGETDADRSEEMAAGRKDAACSAERMPDYKIASPSIRFSCHISPDLPILSADPGKLRQVLDNLIRNAAEAHPNDITLAACMTKGQVILEVSDDGSGIDPNDLSRLFTPFVSCKPGGTGLGLAIAERIIKAHHGTITVRSEPHMQTVFRISLPVRCRQPLQNETISGVQAS